MQWKRLNEIYPNPEANNYFFNSLVTTCNLPFDPEMMAKYYFAKSSNRIISPVAEMYASDDTRIASFLAGTYNKKWNQEMQVVNLEYAPAENYNMNEFGTDNTTNSRNNTSTSTGTDTENVSGNTTRKYTHGESISESGKSDGSSGNDTTSNRYGINTSSAHPDTSQHQSTTDSVTTSHSTTHSGTDNDVTDNTGKVVTNKEQSGKVEENGSEKVEHTLTRKGNIGVTTTQQMLQSELELWKWSFLDSIVADINAVLTLHIY